jgi:hypothetical protein
VKPRRRSKVLAFASIKRRVPLRRVSTGRRKLNALYGKLARAFLEKHPTCALRQPAPSEEIHHKRGRAGTLLIDQRFWAAVSRIAHQWIQNNPVAARSLGLLAEEGLWNSPPRDAESDRLKSLMHDTSRG